MTALIKTCNKFSKFVNNTEQKTHKKTVRINTHACAFSYMHKYIDEKIRHTLRHIYPQISIYRINFKMFNVLFNINCLNVFVKLKDQIILQNKITFEISHVTTKKLNFQISK